MRATTKFRQLLNEPGIIMAPGAYDCVTAKLIETAGFPAVYMTGAGTSVARLGYPDLALATMTEMLDNAGAIASTVEVPVIADADTGYGGVLNVRRTVRQYERSGVAALHLEDQDFPKRCGHLDDKRVIPVDDMVQKIHAAVDARTDDDFTIIVRTDALAVTGWDDSMRRCEEPTSRLGPTCCLWRRCGRPKKWSARAGNWTSPCFTTTSRPASRRCSPPRNLSAWASRS